MSWLRSQGAVAVTVLGLGLAAASPAAKREIIFSQQSGLGRGWKDYGWAPGRRFEAGAPVSLDLSRDGGWIVGRTELAGGWSTLSFKMKAPAANGDFLEVRVDSRRPETFPRVRVGKEYLQPLADGWVQVTIPMRVLDPAQVPFDEVVFRASHAVDSKPVLLDEIVLVGEDPGAFPPAAPDSGPAPAR